MIGRALRRVLYDSFAVDAFDDEPRLTPEYTRDVLGIPFTFIPANSVAVYQPPRPVTTIRAVLPEREALTIEFPRVIGYLVLSCRRSGLSRNSARKAGLTIDPKNRAPTARNEAIVGEGVTLLWTNSRTRGMPTIAFYVAGHALRTLFRDTEGTLKPWLFPQILAITKCWMAKCLQHAGSRSLAIRSGAGPADLAVERASTGPVWTAPGGRSGSCGRSSIPTTRPAAAGWSVFRRRRPTYMQHGQTSARSTASLSTSDWEAAAAQPREEMGGSHLLRAQ